MYLFEYFHFHLFLTRKWLQHVTALCFIHINLRISQFSQPGFKHCAVRHTCYSAHNNLHIMALISILLDSKIDVSFQLNIYLYTFTL